MSRRNPSPGGLRVDLLIDDPDLAARVRAQARRSGSNLSDVIRTAIACTLAPCPATAPVTVLTPNSATSSTPDVDLEGLPLDELRRRVDAAYEAWARETSPAAKRGLQVAHHRLARVLGPRARAVRYEAASGAAAAVSARELDCPLAVPQPDVAEPD